MLLPALVLVLATAAAPQDMQHFLVDTKALVRQGQYAEALGRYLWFHEHAPEFDPRQDVVRLSFALGDWKELADVYPPARQALDATREREAQQILDTGKSWELFADVAAI